jgi:4-phosphopantoate--beta-alanine ligase
VPNVTRHAEELRDASAAELREIVDGFDAEAALADAERTIRGGELG